MELKQLRKQRGLTSSVAAKTLGISQGYYSQLESGKRAFSQAQLQRLSEVLGVSANMLKSVALSVQVESNESSNWVSNLPINGIPLKLWISQTNEFRANTKEQFVRFLVRTISQSIAKELRQEFDSNPQLSTYLFNKVKRLNH